MRLRLSAGCSPSAELASSINIDQGATVPSRNGESNQAASQQSEWQLTAEELCCTVAGLWEFPSVTVPAEASEKERRADVDSLLDTLLGAGRADLQVQERRHLGSIVHIFSHIRMTLHVERLVVKVNSVP